MGAIATRQLLRRALLTGVAASLLACWPGGAHAGTYDVSLCRTPAGGATYDATFRVRAPDGRSGLVARDGCPRGPFELEMSASAAHPADDYLTAWIYAPGDTRIASYRFWRSVQLASGSDYAWAYRERTATAVTELDSCYASDGCTTRGSASDPFGAANLVQATARAGITSLELMLVCRLPDSSSATCPAKAPGAKLQLHGGSVTLEDAYVPVLSGSPTGPLVDPARTLTGVQPVSIAATDRGGGVYQALFEVDGHVVESETIDGNGGECALPFRRAQPCRQSVSGTVSLDTAQLPDGAHSLRILVSDATGTNVAAWGPTTIHTANATCNPTPVSHALRLDAGVQGRRNRAVPTVTAHYGRALLASGSLTTPAGAPVAGAAVCVVAQDDAEGAPLQAYRTVTTSADGRFAYVLRKGASRRVTFVHRAAGGAVVDSVHVRVRAPVRVHGSRHVLRNGGTLLLRGRLGALPIPRRGVLVELQARRDSGWQTFGTVRSDRRGRFRFPYTFTRTIGVQRYVLRARVPEQAAYPFAAGASRPVRVTVSG